MGTFSAFTALRGSAGTWTAPQQFANAPIALAELTNPAAPAAGSNLAHFWQEVDGRPRLANDAGLVFDLGAWRRDAGTTLLRPAQVGDTLLLGGSAAPNAKTLLDLQDATRALVLSRPNDVPNVLGLSVDDGTIAYDLLDHRVRVMADGVWQVVGWTGEVSGTLGALAGRDQDVLPNHLFALGRGCCQIWYGGVEEGGSATIESTRHPNKGSVFIGILEVDQKNQRVGIGAYPPLHTLDVPAGTIRLNTGWTGILRADAGVLSIDPGGAGGGGWNRDTTTGLLYPATAGDRLMLGGSSIHASAQLQGDSTSRGWLPPRMTTTQINSINPGASGEALIAYDTTVHKYRGWDGSQWRYLAWEAGGGGPTLLIEDLFTGTGALSATTGGGSLGSVAWNALLGTFARDTDQAKATGFVALWSVDAADADVSIECQLVTQGTGAAIAFRVQDATHFFFLRNNGTNYNLRLINGVTFTGVGSGSSLGTGSVTPANGDTIKITLSGSSINVYVNGSSTPDISVTNANFSGATAHGLACENQGGATAYRWDTFRVYSA